MHVLSLLSSLKRSSERNGGKILFVNFYYKRFGYGGSCHELTVSVYAGSRCALSLGCCSVLHNRNTVTFICLLIQDKDFKWMCSEK